VTSQLSAALCAAAAGIHPDEAAAELIISRGSFLTAATAPMRIQASG
jgi:hypothetical protein